MEFTTEAPAPEAPPIKPKAARPKPKPKPKPKAKAKPKPKAKPRPKTKPKPKAAKAKPAKKAKPNGRKSRRKPSDVLRVYRIDFRLTKAEKQKLVDRAARQRRTISSVLLQLIEKM